MRKSEHRQWHSSKFTLKWYHRIHSLTHAFLTMMQFYLSLTRFSHFTSFSSSSSRFFLSNFLGAFLSIYILDSPSPITTIIMNKKVRDFLRGAVLLGGDMGLLHVFFAIFDFKIIIFKNFMLKCLKNL